MILPCTGLSTTEAGTGNIAAIVNGDWRTIEAIFNPAWGRTARQDDGSPPGAGNVVTASSPTFNALDAVGSLIRWADGSVAEIIGFTSTTVVTVDDSKTVTDQAFTLFKDPADLDEDLAYIALARGLLKRPALTSSDNGLIPVWTHASKRFVLNAQPGYGVTLGQLLYGGGDSTAPTSSADLAFNDTTDVLTVNGRVVASKHFDTGVLDDTADANDGAIQIDFNQEQWVDINTLQAALTFTSANLVAGRWVDVRIVCDGTPRNLTFPGGWKFVSGAAPANIAAGKTGLLKLKSWGTTDANVVAEWSVEP